MCVCVYLEGRAKALFSLRSCSPVWEGFTGLWHIAQWTQPSIWVHRLTFLTQVDLIQFTQQCHRYPVSPLLDSLLQYSCKLLIFYENNDFNGCLDCGNIQLATTNIFGQDYSRVQKKAMFFFFINHTFEIHTHFFTMRTKFYLNFVFWSLAFARKKHLELTKIGLVPEVYTGVFWKSCHWPEHCQF